MKFIAIVDQWGETAPVQDENTGQTVYDSVDGITTAISEHIREHELTPDKYIVYHISDTFAYVPPTDKGQLVRKDK